MFFYNIVIGFYHLSVFLASLVNPKAKLFVAGRKNILERLKAAKAEIKEPLIWFHCASLGEFEQGRPLIEKLKKEFPDHKILLTFFSPSGYEVRKNYEFADLVFYLPKDTASNARKFLEIVDPKLAIFVKYEFWLNYLNALRTKKVPTLLVSAIFRKEQRFFKWYGITFKRAVSTYNNIFLQNEDSYNLLHENGIKNCSIGGDTRFDRVSELAKHPMKFEALKKYTENKTTIVAGSSWLKDEELLLPVFAELKKNNASLNLIIAPHNVDENSILELITIINKTSEGLSFARYSEGLEDYTAFDIVIIDSIGILSSAYQYGRIAYIGGGFSSGIHNILEAMTFGLPVVFGPNHHKFNEAKKAIELEAGFTFETMGELHSALSKLINDSTFYASSSQKASEYISHHTGSTQKVIDYIKQQHFLGK